MGEPAKRKSAAEHVSWIRSAARYIGESDPVLTLNLLEAADEFQKLDKALKRPVWTGTEWS